MPDSFVSLPEGGMKRQDEIAARWVCGISREEDDEYHKRLTCWI